MKNYVHINPGKSILRLNEITWSYITVYEISRNDEKLLGKHYYEIALYKLYYL